MDGYGRFLDRDVLRHERVLPGTVEEVWEHLTQPEWLAGWLAPGEIEPRVGGAVSFRWQEVSGGTAALGIVTVWDPPGRLAYSWQETASGSEVTFELEPAGEDRVLLRLTHRRMPWGEALGFAHGWHACLDALVAQLDGQSAEAIRTAWKGETIDKGVYSRLGESFGLVP